MSTQTTCNISRSTQTDALVREEAPELSKINTEKNAHNNSPSDFFRV